MANGELERRAGAEAAAAVLGDIEGIRRATRRDVQSFWFPLSLFGALTLASIPFTGVGSAIFWALAAPAAMVAVGAFYTRRERRLGLAGPSRPYVIASLAMVAGAFVISGLVPGRWKGVAWAFPIAAGYIAFGLLDRSRLLGGLGVFMAVVPVWAVAAGVDNRDRVVGAVIVAVLLASGLLVRRWERR